MGRSTRRRRPPQRHVPRSRPGLAAQRLDLRRRRRQRPVVVGSGPKALDDARDVRRAPVLAQLPLGLDPPDLQLDPDDGPQLAGDIRLPRLPPPPLPRPPTTAPPPRPPALPP